MTFFKIVLIVSVVGMLLTLALFYLALAPRITDLGRLPRFQPLLNKSLALKKAVILYDIRNEPYRFCSLSLQEDSRLPFPKTEVLPAGTRIHLTGLKNYYNAVSGSSTIYAIGESYGSDGAVRRFEYQWRTYDGRIDAADMPELPAAAW